MLRRALKLGIAALCVLVFAVAASAQTSTSTAAKKDHAFKGKVEKVDPKTKMVTVNNESIPGWMNSMTMVYKVDKEAVLKDLKAGDQITATVYDGDFQTLYNVKIAPPAKK